MTLKLGDHGDPVKKLQRALNKVGSLLLVDGDYGPGTQAAVVEAYAVVGRPGPALADDALIAALEQRPEPSAELTAAGVTFIGREEVSSPAFYRAKHCFPSCPPRPSGVTIGIGYDLAFVTVAELRADWAGMLPDETITRFLPVIGKEGSDDLARPLRDINVPLPTAVTVFLKRMVPKHSALTRSIYPILDTLPPARRTALISLVFNRGPKLDDKPGEDRRREMKRIQQLLAAGDVDKVAEQLDSMTRIWKPEEAPGLIARRRREATLWRAGFPALQLA
jgi:hypothetical protein